jgi:hypothetical protein
MLDLNGDIELKSFDFSLIVDEDEFTQRILITLRTYLGELFYNINFGTPWYQDILGKQKDISIVESVLKSTISSVPGVDRILEFDMDYDEIKRSLIVDFLALLSTEQELQVEGAVL